MRTLIALFALAIPLAAHAATAYHTGQMRYVTTVTYQQGISCEYNYLGNKFWRTFTGVGSCPLQVEVY